MRILGRRTQWMPGKGVGVSIGDRKECVSEYWGQERVWEEYWGRKGCGSEYWCREKVWE